MSVSARQNPLQSYQLILYGRALHPSHFQLKGRQVVAHDPSYAVEAWVMPGMHAVRFEHRGLCCTEHVTDQDRHIPTGDIIAQHLCASEKEFEHTFARDGVQYLSACQTETLSESLYSEDYDVMLAEGRALNALIHAYEDDAGRCLSMVAMQRLHNEVHVQSCHMIAGAGLVLKTQSIFEVLAGRRGGMIEVKLAPGVTDARRNGR
ncbi:MAG: DUF2617 family protein [Phycisphaerales bacterium]